MAELKIGKSYKLITMDRDDYYYDELIGKTGILLKEYTEEDEAIGGIDVRVGAKKYYVDKGFELLEIPEFDAFPKPSKTDEEDGWKTHSFSELKDHAQHPAAFPLGGIGGNIPPGPFMPKGDGSITLNKREFESGAVRDSSNGKPRPDLISPYMLEALGKVLAKGADHYGSRNWEKGMDNDTLKESAARHYVSWMMNREDEDHAAHLIFNIMAWIHFRDISNGK